MSCEHTTFSLMFVNMLTGKRLRAQTKEVVVDVYEYFEELGRCKRTKGSLKGTSDAKNLSRTSIKRLRKEKLSTGGAAFSTPTKRYRFSRPLLDSQYHSHIQIQKNTGDYHDEMTADHFEEWFGTKLLPNVPPNSLIVMDNASYDSHRSDPVPVLMTISARHSWSSFFVESFFQNHGGFIAASNHKI